MKKHKIVCIVEGGVLQGVYSDWYSSLDTEIILVDQDNINAGDEFPNDEIADIIMNGNQLF